MGKRLPVALAAASIAHAVQMLFFAAAGTFPTPLVFLSHGLVVLAWQVLLAAGLGGLREGRLWGGAVVAVPVVLALAAIPPLSGAAIGAGLAVGGAVFVVVWSAALFGPAAILAEAAAGATVAALIARFRVGVFDMTGAVLLVAAAGAVLLLALAARRFRLGAAMPGRAVALGTGVLVFVASAGILVPERGPAATVPFAAAGSPAAGQEVGPPVVLVVLDTLRASQLAVYGHERDTMPRLERWAAEHAAVGMRAVANGSWTLPSHSSIFTGLYPPRHGAHRYFEDEPAGRGDFGYPLSEEIPTLAAELAGAGYLTMGMSANFGPLSPEFGLARGFQFYSAVPSTRYKIANESPWIANDPKTGWLRRTLAWIERLPPFAAAELFLGVSYRRAEEVSDTAIELVDRAGDRPFFLFVNYLDPHWPYHPPAVFRPDSASLEPGRSSVGPYDAYFKAVMSGRRDVTDSEQRYFAALYEAELAYLDGELERLLRHLMSHPRWDEMLVIVTSDHGDALGEHGTLRHNVGVWDALIRVPLFLKPGGRVAGAPAPGDRLLHPIQSVDLFPTILEHARVPPLAGIDGLAWGRGRTDALAWSYVLPRIAKLDPNRFSSIHASIERDGWKLIRTSAFGGELYDLRADPGERDDLSHAEPGRFEALSEPLRAANVNERRTGTQDLSEETLERLRILGYVDDSDEPSPDH